MQKSNRTLRAYEIVLLVIAFLLPFVYFLKKTITGEFPFWYDSARDFIQASANLHNPTLIGPPSGIPGVFYGPYWIWFISIGELFTKNPRFTVFLLGVIPYGVIFPLILYQLSRKWGIITGILLWVLFATSYAENYATYLWNPHIAPVLFLLYIFLIIQSDFYKKNRKNLLLIFTTGFVGGLITNFHISFGIGVMVSSYVWFIGCYLFGRWFSKTRIKVRLIDFFTSLAIFSLGFTFAFGPFFLFELRNGFHQIKATFSTLTAQGAVVGQTGIDNRGILDQFVLVFQKLFHISYQGALLVIFSSIVLAILFFLQKKRKKKAVDFKLVSLLLTMFICIGSIYLWSKNPVWEYHFIGVEIVVLLLIGALISQSKILKIAATCWVIFILFNFSIHAIKDLKTNKLTIPTLYTKEHITDVVYTDAGSQNFEVFIYSPSIYAYDYSYIFGYRGSKKYVSARPEDVPQDSNLVYIILPPGEEGARQDFIHYRTPIKKYKTTKTIDIPDGTQIVKREKVKEE